MRHDYGTPDSVFQRKSEFRKAGKNLRLNGTQCLVSAANSDTMAMRSMVNCGEHIAKPCSSCNIASPSGPIFRTIPFSYTVLWRTEWPCLDQECADLSWEPGSQPAHDARRNGSWSFLGGLGVPAPAGLSRTEAGFDADSKGMGKRASQGEIEEAGAGASGIKEAVRRRLRSLRHGAVWRPYGRRDDGAKRVSLEVREGNRNEHLCGKLVT